MDSRRTCLVPKVWVRIKQILTVLAWSQRGLPAAGGFSADFLSMQHLSFIRSSRVDGLLSYTVINAKSILQ